MFDNRQVERVRYRVWIVRYAGPPPAALHARPAQSIALRPAFPGTISRRKARCYVTAFNRVARAGPTRVWAVALPVTLHYAGDLQPGQPLVESS